jgi:predicted nucleotide-binding protein
VVFELGFFFGKLGRENVAVLYATDVEKPSDVEGLVYVPFEGNWRERVIRELRDAGLDFSLDRLA